MFKEKKWEKQKKLAAQEALAYVENDMIIGVGTGSTTNYFIDMLAHSGKKIAGAIPSSVATEKKLKALNIPVVMLNHVQSVPLYIDGADRFNDLNYLIKGGGGALCREKIIAKAAGCFICMVDESKYSASLSGFPLPIEVIPMARSFVAREIMKQIDGDPIFRENCLTDNGNIILDIFNLTINEPLKLESVLNQIPGVVAHGLFASIPADIIFIGEKIKK